MSNHHIALLIGGALGFFMASTLKTYPVLSTLNSTLNPNG